MKKLYFLAICFSLVSSNLVAQETTEKQQLKKTTNGVSVADMDIRKLTWKAMNGSNTPPPSICPNSTRISGVIVTIPEVLDWDSSLRTHTISNLDSSLKKQLIPI